MVRKLLRIRQDMFSIVQVIMERMHGGGHLSAAALQRENTSVEDLRTELIATLDEVMKEE